MSGSAARVRKSSAGVRARARLVGARPHGAACVRVVSHWWPCLHGRCTHSSLHCAVSHRAGEWPLGHPRVCRRVALAALHA
eukprot:2466539-Alexandrium_andersonii.AAC.1